MNEVIVSPKIWTKTKDMFSPSKKPRQIPSRRPPPQIKTKVKINRKSKETAQTVSLYPSKNDKTQPPFYHDRLQRSNRKLLRRVGPRAASTEEDDTHHPANHLHKRAAIFTRLRTNTSAWRLTSPDAAVVSSPYQVNCQANFIFNAYFIYVC